MGMGRRWRCVARAVLCIFTAAGALQAHAQAAAQVDDFQDKLMQLGTGPEGGTFRPIGVSLCDAINESRAATSVRCVPLRSAGSTFNIHAVASGTLQLGLAQEDLVANFHARGDEGGDRLRLVALMHNSPIAVMVRREAGIGQLAQIAGKKFNKGNRGSGQHAVATALLKALNIRDQDLAAVSYLPTSEFQRAFCKGEVDVVIEAVAHPSELFRKLRDCGGEFLDIPPEVATKMVSENRFLRPMDIPAGTYEGQDKPVRTLGMRNLLITNASVDAEAVFRVATLLQKNFDKIKARQPFLRSTRPLTAADAGSLALPLHPGAARALQAGTAESQQ